MNKCVLSLAILVVAGLSFASSPDEGPHAAGQAIADRIRELAGSDMAFVPGGILQDVKTKGLVDFVTSPNERVVVVKLTGAQVQAALERSVSMVPNANPSFLQVSGLTATYRKNAVSGRLGKVLTDMGDLDLKGSYTVAMPQTMAKGGFGYFTVWDAKAIVETKSQTLADALKGLAVKDSEPRYKAVESF